MRTRFLSVSVLGSIVIAMTAWLASIGPSAVAHPVADDPRAPIIAFELARSLDDLRNVIGENGIEPSYRQVRDAFDRLNRLDFFYLTAYGLFVSAFFWAATPRLGWRWLHTACALGLIAALGDIGENLILLELTSESSDPASLLEALHVRTWVKWGALGLAASLAGAVMGGDARAAWLRYAGAFAGAAALLLTVASYFSPVELAQLMAFSIFAAWLVQIFYAVRIAMKEQ